jgi:hypothetical protein
VLKDNSKGKRGEVKVKPYPRKVICYGCESELEYEESDMYEGEYGCMYVDCPICDEQIMLEDNEKNITLTVDNIKFPVHFHHVSSKNAKERCNTEEIRKELKRAVEYFRKNKDEYNWHTWSGNLFVMVHRWSGDEDYEVVISNDFYNMEIDFEDEDYE